MAERERRALKQVRGRVTSGGDRALAEVLTRAWERASVEDPDRLTHGFHSWPARMHPAIAREVLQAVEARSVLDPFCGGGTVLVEAMVAGRRCVGVDLDPLSPLLCDVKTELRDAGRRARFVAAAEAVAAASEARVRARVPIRVGLPPQELRWYAPHVLKELGGLLEEIEAWAEPSDRRALAMVFSSIVVKVSKQLADTSERETERRIRKGLSTEIFLRRARELAERWAALAELTGGPRPQAYEGDARHAERGMDGRKVDLVLSSPPYGGTYDYAEHHARRAAWLGLDASRLRRLEVGARRSTSGEGGLARWDREVDEVLGAMAAVLRPRGLVVLVMGDAEVGEERVDVLPQLERLGPRHGLEPLARASQPRPDWRGGRPREEHIVALRAGG